MTSCLNPDLEKNNNTLLLETNQQSALKQLQPESPTIKIGFIVVKSLLIFEITWVSSENND